MLTFFERSPLDQVLKNDNVHKIQPSFQSPVKISGKSYREGVGRPGTAVGGRGFPETLPVHCLAAGHTFYPWDPERRSKRIRVGGGCYPIFMKQYVFHPPTYSLHFSNFQRE